jgi:hypothetical protein
VCVYDYELFVHTVVCSILLYSSEREFNRNDFGNEFDCPAGAVRRMIPVRKVLAEKEGSRNL